MAMILNGADVVNALNSKMTAEVEQLKNKGITPTLAILRVGEKPDDISYERTATKRGESVGITVKNLVLPVDVTHGELMRRISELNDDTGIHGVLMLRPLPRHLDGGAACAALKPDKDIDGITEGSLAGVFTGGATGFTPCTAQACIEILDHYNIDCTGKRAVVIGRSLVVGKPVAIMLLNKNATVTVCHTKTVDLPAVARCAEILIVAAGQPEGLTAEYFSPGQTVIDVGINWSDEKRKLCGDVKFEDAEPIVSAITPVPGGVGTVTTSVLISHVVEAARNQHEKQRHLSYDRHR